MYLHFDRVFPCKSAVVKKSSGSYGSLQMSSLMYSLSRSKPPDQYNLIFHFAFSRMTRNLLQAAAKSDP